MNKRNLAVMLVLAISVMAQVAGAVSLSFSAGKGTGSAGTSLNSNLHSDGDLHETSVASFGSGVSLIKSSSGNLNLGSGSLSEHHWAKNAEGDYAGVDASLKGSKSWSYRFMLSSGEDKVSASEDLGISSGTGINLSAQSGNNNGDEALVRVLGAEDAPSSMRYSNYAEATKGSAYASQNVDGLTTSGRSVGSGTPLIIEGWALKGSDEQDLASGVYGQYASAWASVLGGSQVSSSISVKSDSSGAYSSQKLRASKFNAIAADEVAGSGILSQSLFSDRCASVFSGAVDGNSFSSAIDASSTKDGALASQTVNAKGDLVYKGMLAGEKGYEVDGSLAGYEITASGYSEVAGGSLASKDRAQSSQNVARVSEDFSARGNVFREVDASTMWQGDPSWKGVRSETYADGSLSGRSQASSQPGMAKITGKWVATSREYYPERNCWAENSTLGMNMWILGDIFYPFDESVISTEGVLDAY
jgi:hypothetical protein